MQESEIYFKGVNSYFGWLNMMHPCSLKYEGDIYGSAEALYQALRFEKGAFRERIHKATSADYSLQEVTKIMNELRKKGDMHRRIVEPCSEEDLKNMEMCIRLRVTTIPETAYALLKTVGRNIVQGYTSNSQRPEALFRGVIEQEDGTRIGENWVGKIWVKLREEMIQELSQKPASVLYGKFGMEEDPYHYLRKEYNQGYTIFVLHLNNMGWYSCEKPDFKLPPHFYAVQDSRTDELYNYKGKKMGSMARLLSPLKIFKDWDWTPNIEY
jgi:predicted NAD-dependent protein-ADP-ribosyltransferase YbiA (DUF1768 family)